MKIFITGDTHGDIDWGKLTTKRFPYQKNLTKDDLVIITGDAGIVWDAGKTDKYLIDKYNKRNFTTVYVDGNHENHDALDSYPVEMWNGGKIHRISDSIVHLMRGQIYTINGKTFFTMGGATSTDKAYRKEGISWWARELPSKEEYEEAMDNLRKHDFKVNYVITHCAPEGVYGIERERNELTRFFDNLINVFNLQFDEWFCGHYHTDASDNHINILYNSIINLESFDSRMPEEKVYEILFKAQRDRKLVRITDDIGQCHEGNLFSIQESKNQVVLGNKVTSPISTLSIVKIEVLDSMESPEYNKSLLFVDINTVLAATYRNTNPIISDLENRLKMLLDLSGETKAKIVLVRGEDGLKSELYSNSILNAVESSFYSRHNPSYNSDQNESIINCLKIFNKSYETYEKYCILSCCQKLSEDNIEHLIYVDPEVGITDEIVEEVKRRLRKDRNKIDQSSKGHSVI